MRISFGELRTGEAARLGGQNRIDKNWVSEGENVAEFERSFVSHFGYGRALGTSSGTDAVLVASTSFYADGAERGDEIIVPACSFVVTSNAVLAVGFVPRFVDVDRASYNIQPELIETAITPRTRAISRQSSARSLPPSPRPLGARGQGGPVRSLKEGAGPAKRTVRVFADYGCVGLLRV